MRRIQSLLLAAIAAFVFVVQPVLPCLGLGPAPATASIRFKSAPIRFHNPSFNPGTGCCYADTSILTLGGTQGWGNADTSVVFAWPADAIVPPWLATTTTAADTLGIIGSITVESDSLNGVTGSAFGMALDAIPTSVTGSSATGATIVTSVPLGFVVDSVACVTTGRTSVGATRQSITFLLRNYHSPQLLRRLAGSFGPLPYEAFNTAQAFRVRLVGASTSFVQRARITFRYWADEK